MDRRKKSEVNQRLQGEFFLEEKSEAYSSLTDYKICNDWLEVNWGDRPFWKEFSAPGHGQQEGPIVQGAAKKAHEQRAAKKDQKIHKPAIPGNT